MKVDIKLPVALAMLMPVAAFAGTEGPVEVFFSAAAGGAVGGLLGALLACWLCKRHGSKSDGDSKKY